MNCIRPLSLAAALLAFSCAPEATTYLVVSGASPLVVHQARLDTASMDSLKSADPRCAAAYYVGSANGGVWKTTNLVMDELPSNQFMAWANDQMEGKTTPSPQAQLVVNAGGEAVCTLDLPSFDLQGLTLRRNSLAWDLGILSPVQATKGGVFVAAGDVNGDGAGVDPDTGDITNGGGEPVAIGLLVPAVQKVRSFGVPPQASTAEGYPLYVKGGVPPPFDLQLESEAINELRIEQAASGALTDGLMVLRFGATTAGKQLKMDSITIKSSGATFVPASSGGFVLPSAPRADPVPMVTALSAQASPDLDQSTDLQRLTDALSGQPSLSGNPVTAKNLLTAYWTGPGNRLNALKAGLAGFLERSAEEEGHWAYKRLLTAAHLYNALDPTDGMHPAGIDAEEIINARLVASAALDGLATASFPMTPGTIRSVAVASSHHYKQAVITCRKAGRDSEFLVNALPAQLVGVEPDEIDAAVAMKAELDITVEEVDAMALAYLDALNAVLNTAVPTGAEIDAVAARTQDLRQMLTHLAATTQVRFAVTH